MGKRELVPICLALAYADDPVALAALEARVDLRAMPTTGRVRVGVDPLAALRVSKPAPRANSGARRKAADRENRELWLSHPFLPDTWLHVWVSPATHEIARALETRGSIDVMQRAVQPVEGVSQRIADLRALGVVVLSTRVPNQRLPKGAYVVKHELLSKVKTTPPPKGAVVVDLADELRALTANPGVRASIIAKIDAQAASRKQLAMARLNRATAATSRHP